MTPPTGTRVCVCCLSRCAVVRAAAGFEAWLAVGHDGGYCRYGYGSRTPGRPDPSGNNDPRHWLGETDDTTREACQSSCERYPRIPIYDYYGNRNYNPEQAPCTAVAFATKVFGGRTRACDLYGLLAHNHSSTREHTRCYSRIRSYRAVHTLTASQYSIAGSAVYRTQPVQYVHFRPDCYRKPGHRQASIPSSTGEARLTFRTTPGVYYTLAVEASYFNSDDVVAHVLDVLIQGQPAPYSATVTKQSYFRAAADWQWAQTLAFQATAWTTRIVLREHDGHCLSVKDSRLYELFGAPVPAHACAAPLAARTTSAPPRAR